VTSTLLKWHGRIAIYRAGPRYVHVSWPAVSIPYRYIAISSHPYLSCWITRGIRDHSTRPAWTQKATIDLKQERSQDHTLIWPQPNSLRLRLNSWRLIVHQIPCFYESSNLRIYMSENGHNWHVRFITLGKRLDILMKRQWTKVVFKW